MEKLLYIILKLNTEKKRQINFSYLKKVNYNHGLTPPCCSTFPTENMRKTRKAALALWAKCDAHRSDRKPIEIAKYLFGTFVLTSSKAVFDRIGPSRGKIRPV